MFQSTLPHGERPHRHADAAALPCFNPRSHMGSDFRPDTTFTNDSGFNPRSHMGSDLIMKLYILNEVVSIHAPTWGATSYDEAADPLLWFQSTLPHGERLTPVVVK